MSSNKQTLAIKVEEPRDKIYLHSITIPGVPSASRQFSKSCSYPYTSQTPTQQNEVPLSLIRSILSDRLPSKATRVTLEWRLSDITESSYPIFTTRHNITDDTSKDSGHNVTIVFADSLDWAQKITSNHKKIRKAQQDAQAHLKRNPHLTPPLSTAPGGLPRHQQHGVSKRRRRGQPTRSQQPCLSIINEFRRRAEQHNKATGDVNGLLLVMRVQQCMMAGRSNMNRCHHQILEPRSLSPSTNSVCSE
ncbi:hypothetical protein B0T21DRAFT_362097 [Apiosordaria backusii]|uniref:Uncharacterized protein n=1 Tax=Apiosordaria backusii TaxID=314023 RepID=A0AA40BRY8_9PEZI|nr:hypothetical protein B0T21DRAFT_362097 [Apiosordaria backusii]